MSHQVRVAVIGATGIAGQQALAALVDHTWFDVTAIAASERSAGKTYKQAITSEAGQVQWYAGIELPDRFAKMTVQLGSALDVGNIDIILDCVETSAARQLEEQYAPTTPVVSTASAFRYEDDVPIFIPGVNLEHAGLLAEQQKRRGWKGFVTPIPNCTTTGLAMALAPLYREFGINRVFMTSLQAISGAGRSPGVSALDIMDNVIPYIPGEEEKVERETQKILGKLVGSSIDPATFDVSSTCMRVGVSDGHTESVFVELEKDASVDAVEDAMTEFGTDFVGMGLPSSPGALITVSNDPYRPQPKLDRELEGGMTTVVGRLREDKALERGIKFVLLSHNTMMGAAKGAVLVAEYLVEKGHIA